jgi:hypothetical protein
VSCEGLGDLTLWELCSLACVAPAFGEVAICCGDAGATRFEVTVPPDISASEATCDQDVSIDMTQVLQVQAQICVGGQIDLCHPDVDSLSFPCTGEGSETVAAISRVRIGADPADANHGPTIETPLWGRLESTAIEPWGAEPPLEIAGCLDEDCTDRECDSQEDCRGFDERSPGRLGATSCHEGRCKEEFSVALSPEAQETYLRPCDPEEPCESDDDCPASFVCDCGHDGPCDEGEGSCRRIENPVVAFFADGGAFAPGRSVLDTDGDGRPDRSRFRTRWLPPVLEECSIDADCAPGACDLDAGRCARDVSLWVVARDGRGGQEWVERSLRVVP